DIDQVGMARPVVKWAAEPAGVEQIPFYLQRAYVEADSGRKGAVHLTIPVDLFRASGPAKPGGLSHLPRGLPHPDSNDVAIAVNLLRSARRPVTIAGSGVWWSHAEDAL